MTSRSSPGVTPSAGRSSGAPLGGAAISRVRAGCSESLKVEISTEEQWIGGVESLKVEISTHEQSIGRARRHHAAVHARSTAREWCMVASRYPPIDTTLGRFAFARWTA